MGTILKLVGRGVKRAFTKDGGNLAIIKDFTGRRDGVYWIALAIRTFAAGVAAGLAMLIAHLVGVPVLEVIDTMNSIKE
jgi:hypothetical protein